MSINDLYIRRYNMLFQLNERLTKSRLKGDNLSVEEYRDDLVAACETVRFLAQDEQFHDVIRHFDMKNHNQDLIAEAKRIFSDFDLFFEYMRIEKGWLIKSGLSEEAADSLLAAQMLVKDMIDPDHGVDPEALIQSLPRFASEVCDAAEAVHENIEAGEKFHQILRVFFFGVGASTSIVNSIFAVTSAGTLLPYAIASGLLGTAGMGIGTFMKK